MSEHEQDREAVGPRLDRGVVPMEPKRDLSRMEQLLAFCDWERKHNRHPEGKPHIAEWAAAELERQAEEVRKLRAFANDIMDCWPEGDVDGAYLQDMAEKHGLLVPERQYQPCGEACTCAGTVEHADWVDGVTCYRRTALLKGHNVQGEAGTTGARPHRTE